MKALLVGYGKMGKAVEIALMQSGHEVAGRIGRREIFGEEIFLEGNRAEGNAATGSASPPHAAPPPFSPSKKSSSFYSSSSSDLPVCDLAFEFTTPASAPIVVPFLLSRKIPVLSGTTGWDVTPAAHMAREQKIPFLHASNFSLGIAALRRAVAAAAAALAPFPEFEPGIMERHHAAKKDAPSGTARVLALDISREPLSKRSVPIVSLRQGAQPGEHSVFFEGADETVELVHRARSRSIFARGAVRAGEWMIVSGRTGPVTFDEFFDDLSLKGGTS
jgi:4-hydroxy-tetrahydrodipicolinate reductase